MRQSTHRYTHNHRYSHTHTCRHALDLVEHSTHFHSLSLSLINCRIYFVFAFVSLGMWTNDNECREYIYAWILRIKRVQYAVQYLYLLFVLFIVHYSALHSKGVAGQGRVEGGRVIVVVALAEVRALRRRPQVCIWHMYLHRIFTHTQGYTVMYSYIFIYVYSYRKSRICKFIWTWLLTSQKFDHIFNTLSR